MPEKETIERARKDKRAGKSASTQAGEFVREEIHHVREGKHGARSAKQAIAIGLSKARRAGVDLPPPEEASAETKRSAKSARSHAGKKPSPSRSRATRGALKRYEAAKGLPADGRPDAQVLASLGVDPDRQPPPPPAAAPVGPGAAGALAAARSVLGAPYASAGTTPAGFDCSGLTRWAFKQAGISLPRTSYAQYGVGTAIDRSQIQAGDLVFFSTNGGGASHVGIATSPTTVISATTRGVREHAIGDDYWGSHYVGARRV